MINPYAILGAVVFWIATVASVWLYRGHIDAQACAAKITAMQLEYQKQQTAIANQNEQAAAQTVADTNTVSTEHQNNDQVIVATTQQKQVQIRFIHDAAPAADCLRQPVAAAVDLLLRNPTASTNRPPTGAAAH